MRSTCFVLFLAACGGARASQPDTPAAVAPLEHVPPSEPASPSPRQASPGTVEPAQTLDELCRNVLPQIAFDESEGECRGLHVHEPTCRYVTPFDANGHGLPDDATEAPAAILLEASDGCRGMDHASSFLAIALRDRYEIPASVAHWITGPEQTGTAELHNFEMRDGYAVAEVATFDGGPAYGETRHLLVVCVLEPRVLCGSIPLSSSEGDPSRPTDLRYGLRYYVEGSDVVIERVSGTLPPDLEGETGRRPIADFVESHAIDVTGRVN